MGVPAPLLPPVLPSAGMSFGDVQGFGLSIGEGVVAACNRCGGGGAGAAAVSGGELPFLPAKGSMEGTAVAIAVAAGGLDVIDPVTGVPLEADAASAAAAAPMTTGASGTHSGALGLNTMAPTPPALAFAAAAAAAAWLTSVASPLLLAAP